MSENGNGKWQLGFWLFATIAGVWLLALTNGVIANDRIRQTGDDKLNEILSCDRQLFMEKFSAIQSQLAEMRTDLKYIRNSK